jgi:DNA-binding transcriptional LysR family regulator
VLDYLRAIAVFAKTVELGSFRGAARSLGLSPSVVSHHVAQLEAALDVALLYRTTRRLALTDAGKELFEAARDMVAAAERGLGVVSRDADNPTGTLRIAAPASLLSDALYADLAAFCAAFPRVTLAMELSDVQIDMINKTDSIRVISQLVAAM